MKKEALRKLLGQEEDLERLWSLMPPDVEVRAWHAEDGALPRGKAPQTLLHGWLKRCLPPAGRNRYLRNLDVRFADLCATPGLDGRAAFAAVRGHIRETLRLLSDDGRAPSAYWFLTEALLRAWQELIDAQRATLRRRLEQDASPTDAEDTRQLLRRYLER